MATPGVLHDLARSLLPRERLAQCGRAVRFGSSGVTVYRTESGKLAYRGLYRCGDYWRCPSCAVTLGIRRSRQIDAAATQHVSSGGSLALMTLTVPHTYDDALSAVLGRLARSWRALSRSWKRVLHGSFLGLVRSLEVTHGAAGWHPHYHLLLFFASSPDPALVASLYAAKREWCALSGAAEGANDVRLVADGDAASLARYMVKQRVSGAADELSRSPNKLPHGRSYFRLLEDYAAWRSPVDMRLIGEYAATLHGVHHLSVSPALRKRYDFTDPALNWSEVVDDQVVMTMTIDDYRTIADASPGVAQEFLQSLQGTMTNVGIVGNDDVVYNSAASGEGI